MSLYDRLKQRLAGRKRKLAEHKRKVEGTRKAIKKVKARIERTPKTEWKPRIITAERIGITVSYPHALGPELYVTGHHSAGPADTSDEHAIQLVRQFHRDHAAKYGAGGIGYHYNITRRGTIIGLRPTNLLGAHVGEANSNNIGVLFHGTTGDRPSPAQERAYRWLLANAHTPAMPKAHRTDRDLRNAKRLGHNDWPAHRSNACPGTHKKLILTLNA